MSQKQPAPGTYEEMYVRELGEVPWKKKGGVLGLPSGLSIREIKMAVSDQASELAERGRQAVARTTRRFRDRLRRR